LKFSIGILRKYFWEYEIYFFRALKKNWRMLIGTFLFMILVIFSFSFIISLRFRDEFDSQVVGEIRTCDSFFRCFIYTLDLGKKNDNF